MVVRIRQAEAVLGHGRKEPLPIEEELRSFARRSIFATRGIEKGEELTAENIAVLRSGKLGSALSPDMFNVLLGKKAVRPIREESLITWEDLE